MILTLLLKEVILFEAMAGLAIAERVDELTVPSSLVADVDCSVNE